MDNLFIMKTPSFTLTRTNMSQPIFQKISKVLLNNY